MNPITNLRSSALLQHVRSNPAPTMRRLLLATASIIVLGLHAPPAAADDECGALAGTPAAVTCPVAVDNYPNGVTYSTTADATVNLADGVVINRTASPGAGVSVSNIGGALVINGPNSTISTTQAGSAGVVAQSAGADVAVTVGQVSTTGDFSPAVVATSSSAVNVTATGPVTTTGQASMGIIAASSNGPVVVNAGDISATGQLSTGIIALSSRGPGEAVTGPDVNISVDGNVQGGWSPAATPIPATLPATLDPATVVATPLAQSPSPFAAGVAASGETVTVTNNGTIGALSDRALVLYGGTITVNNLGTVLGAVSMPGATDTTFNNSSGNSLDLRNFADTDGDGVRDTEGVAISDFGAGNAVFNNAATGAVRLVNVPGASTFDTTGALIPQGLNPAFYDITLNGVEQGQLNNLTTFNNAGAIIMQDMMAGGTAPVAGDVLSIHGGANGPATFVSNGGALYLDTVLNQGGAAASQSDVLMVDQTALGTGPTRIFVQNAGGLGAKTVENGILVVDVADPANSAAGAFTLGNKNLIVGAYRYQLFEGGDAANGGDPGDGDWYLRSSLSPTLAAYAAYPAQLLRAQNATIGTMQQRIGNRWWRRPEQTISRTVTDPPLPPPPPPPPVATTKEFIVYFAFDRANLNAEAQATVNEAAEFAKNGQATRIEVSGHTDRAGSNAYNDRLSRRRAQAVVAALQAQGVTAHIETEALGETSPAVPTPDGQREQRNRRVVVEVETMQPAEVAETPPPPAEPRTHVETQTIPASTEIRSAGAWLRVAGSDGSYGTGGVGADENTWLVQGGAEFDVHHDDNGTTLAGFFLNYGEQSTDVSTSDFGHVANIDTNGWGGGLTITWYDPQGLYVDGVLGANWYNADAKSSTLDTTLASGNDATTWAASLEVGKRYEASSHHYWVPQAQLIYSSSDFHNFTDPFGAEVHEDNSDALVSRFGVAYEYNSLQPEDGGNLHGLQAYGITNLYWNILQPPSIKVADVTFKNEDDDLWGELGAGFTWSSAAWSWYGEADYRTSLNNFGDSDNLYGTIGIRYHW